jgi:hypothetical protein
MEIGDFNFIFPILINFSKFLGMLRGLFGIGIGIEPSGSFLICLSMEVELLWSVVLGGVPYIKIGKGGVSVREEVKVRSQRQHQGQRLSGPKSGKVSQIKPQTEVGLRLRRLDCRVE